MLVDLLFPCLEFAIQTVILFGLLWLMIKIQKLDQRFEFRFLGVLGAAALANGLNLVLQIILGHFIGPVLVTYISGPIVFIVLLYRIKKVTGADYVDALFTVVISRALLFAVNLLLLAGLTGDLRARMQSGGEVEAAGPRPRIRAEPPAAADTNAPILKTNPPVVAPVRPVPANPVEGAASKPAPLPIPVTNMPAPSPATNLAAPPAPAKPAESRSKYFSVKGVTRNGANSAVTIQSGTKVYTVFLDEAALMQTVDGPISVRFAELGESSVTLEINGETATFRIP